MMAIIIRDEIFLNKNDLHATSASKDSTQLGCHQKIIEVENLPLKNKILQIKFKDSYRWICEEVQEEQELN